MSGSRSQTTSLAPQAPVDLAVYEVDPAGGAKVIRNPNRSRVHNGAVPSLPDALAFAIRLAVRSRAPDHHRRRLSAVEPRQEEH